MTFVVDAGVAAKWFVAEALHAEATRLLAHAGELRAPAILVPDTASVLWVKCRRGEMTAVQAKAAVAAVHLFVPTLAPVIELHERALDIALELGQSLGGCFYLACAERLDCPLITADAAWHRRLANGPYAPLVRYLAETSLVSAAA